MEVRPAAQNMVLLRQGSWAGIYRMLILSSLAGKVTIWEEQGGGLTNFSVQKEGEVVGQFTFGIKELPALTPQRVEENIKVLAQYPSGSEKRAIEKVLNHLVHEGSWPNQEKMRAWLLAEFDFDFKDLVFQRKSWIRAYQHGLSHTDARITLSGACFCKGTEWIGKAFVLYLKEMLASWYAAPSHKHPTSAERLAERIGVEGRQRRIFELLLREEHVGSNIEPYNDEPVQSYTPRDDVIPFRKVEKIEDYIWILVRSSLENPSLNMAKPAQAATAPPTSLGTESLLREVVKDDRLFQEVKIAFVGGAYGQAVKLGMGVFEDRMWSFRGKDWKEATKALVTLVPQLFHEKTGAYRFPFLKDDEQQAGMYFIYLGMAKALRNRTAHGTFEATKEEAIQILGFVDYLLSLEQGVRKTTGPKSA